jgi:hypothetical protein
MIRRLHGISRNDLALLRMDGALSVVCGASKLKFCDVTIRTGGDWRG